MLNYKFHKELVKYWILPSITDITERNRVCAKSLQIVTITSITDECNPIVSDQANMQVK
jgi:hypothetical protein